jgi:hypothetical protein
MKIAAIVAWSLRSAIVDGGDASQPIGARRKPIYNVDTWIKPEETNIGNNTTETKQTVIH